MLAAIALVLPVLLALFQAQPADLSAASDLELARATVGQPVYLEDEATGFYGPTRAWTELRRRQESGAVFEPEFWRTLLVDGGYVRWRRDWPIDEPFAIALHAPPLEQGFELRLEPRVLGWRPAEATHWEMMCGLAMDSQYARESYQPLGRLGPAQTRIVFDVFATVRSDAKPSSGRTRAVRPRPRRVGEVEIAVQARANLDEVLQRIDAAGLVRELTRLAELGVAANSEGGRRSNLTIRDATWPKSIACTLDVELLHDGDVVSSTRMPIAGSFRRAGFCWLNKLSPQILYGSKLADGWALRLRGSPADTLRDWDATHYWSGEVELSVAELVARIPRQRLSR